MATWWRSERTVLHVEYSVPAGELGACWNQVAQALNAAIDELRGDRPADWEPTDDAIRVVGGDDEIVIRFEAPKGRG
jgi:hypothetical protein